MFEIPRQLLFAAFGAVLTLWLSAGATRAAERLVVHEWGTFTALQDETGKSLGAINVDDEPLPKFVHNLHPYVLGRPQSAYRHDQKGAPPRHPLVRLRLETPVVYFYPPKDAKLPLVLDVHVDFRGGWLTEFYPNAKADAPGLKRGDFRFGPLTPKTVGSLEWKGLQVGTRATGPATSEHVWTAPRATDAVTVTSMEGESENYLFYRGVGNFESPLSVAHDVANKTLKLRANFREVLLPPGNATIGPLWLVEVRKDGGCAFRTLDNIEADEEPEKLLGTASSAFSDTDYSPTNLKLLADSMQPALVAAGLYPKEAAAMLETWRTAYFKTPGLRLFYIVPRSWTDYYLPLRISQPAKIERVLVGRLELISNEQRQTLKELRTTPLSDLRWLEKAYESKNAERFIAGRSDFGDLGVEIPRDFQLYLDLGRFRNALVLHEDARRPSVMLGQFIEAYGLESFRWEQRGEVRQSTGEWKIDFANGVSQVCRVREDGTATIAESQRISLGKAVVHDGSVVIVYEDDRIERWTPVGDRRVVEHWFPGSQFPTATPVFGIAERL